ncbi:MAG: pterin-4-alpha-carbinolamine dehydratase [Flavobacteriaceae bacterium]|nr:pterin-4-alpha-carbinolamine dehydratase [Flavobacteriaceae bacterium]|tara:strand:- start:7265 stop:7504 length:240 start_codon:yes stop_codon:yes gene_type:complete
MKTDWKIKDNRLTKEFVFKDFKESLIFINKVGDESETLNHHPKITNIYNKVTIELWTHTVDNITDLDYKLSEKIDKLIK